jgi:AcrR family transcriptional regulator
MGRREDNKTAKRLALIDAGLALFGSQGFERTSIEQIAAEAGVARGTFYLYFEDKWTLFDAVIDGFMLPLMTVFDDVEEAIQGASTSQEVLAAYQRMALQIAAVGLTQRQRVVLLFREMRGQGIPRLRERERDLIDRVTSLTALARERGLVDVDDPRLASLVILGAIERLFFEVLLGEIEVGEPSALAGDAARLLSRVLGLRT